MREGESARCRTSTKGSPVCENIDHDPLKSPDSEYVSGIPRVGDCEQV
jgi:hypothetical protein